MAEKFFIIHQIKNPKTNRMEAVDKFIVEGNSFDRTLHDISGYENKYYITDGVVYNNIEIKNGWTELCVNGEKPGEKK